MRHFVTRLACAIALVLPMAAAPTIAAAQGSDCLRGHKQSKSCKQIDFRTGSDVSGTTPKGDGDDIRAAKRVTHSNLIKLRWSFADKIVRTGERI